MVVKSMDIGKRERVKCKVKIIIYWLGEFVYLYGFFNF